jgi:Family of unknown function (DUF6352)
MTDFWLSCGHHLLDRDDGGGLVVTDEFLKAYLARPELKPPPDACVVERTLHAALMADPRRPVVADEIALIEEPDARENWQVMIDFRDHLLRHRTLEAAYVALIRHGVGATPPLFLNQLVHVILRNALDGCDDPTVLRAAELFFRPQRATVHEGSLLLADEERIAGTTQGALSPLVSMLGIERSAEIDVLNEANAQTYWQRSDRFDMALDLTAGRAGMAALGVVIECWIGHVLAVAAEIEPLVEIRDAAFTWYVGLDAEATRIGDALWRGDDPDDDSFDRVVAVYRLRFTDPGMVIDKVAGEPVYLILAMTPDRVIRVKPQNLVSGLPIKYLQAVFPDSRSVVVRQ